MNVWAELESSNDYQDISWKNKCEHHGCDKGGASRYQRTQKDA